MKNKLEQFKEYTQKEGIMVSLVITLFCMVLLCTVLILSAFNSRSAEPFCQINLIFEFIYGIILSFFLLRRRERYSHLIPFLFLNWLIGCFSLNVLIPIFEDLPIWVYILTLTFCISNFFIYNRQNERNIPLTLLFINGLSYSIILYYALFLIPISIISLVTILLLGLGFYGLVPAIISLIHLTTLLRLFNNDIRYIT
ncbi:MAG TPA: hypothetical protein VFQ56_06410, partial [Flavobacterium sp.]|nr:hypothetical protein [Flavobacterium sp.]